MLLQQLFSHNHSDFDSDFHFIISAMENLQLLNAIINTEFNNLKFSLEINLNEKNIYLILIGITVLCC